jgi:hypothetical protein
MEGCASVNMLSTNEIKLALIALIEERCFKPLKNSRFSTSLFTFDKEAFLSPFETNLNQKGLESGVDDASSFRFWNERSESVQAGTRCRNVTFTRVESSR